MRKILSFFIGIFAVSVLSAQIISNGGFEDWSSTNPTGWVGTKTSSSTYLAITKVLTNTHSGLNSCGLTNLSSTSHSRFTTTAVSVENGITYSISFWVRGSGQVRTGLYTGINSSSSGYVPYNSYVTVSNEWTYVTQNVTSDGSVTNAEFIISVGMSSDVVIDDVNINESVIYDVSINEIQYTSTPDGASPYSGYVVNTYGVVTALDYNTNGTNKGYYIQNGDYYWSGIYVYDNAHFPAVGDYISVTGTVNEYYGLTQIINVSNYTYYNSNNYVYVTESNAYYANSESLESVLVRINNAECVTMSDVNGEWLIFDNTDTLIVDDAIYNYTPELNTPYNITGVITYNYNNFKICPRNVNDILLMYEIVASDNTICPNSNVYFYITGDNIYNVEWNFGDGGMGSYNYINHTYYGAGTYVVTATVTDYNYETYVLSDTVFVGNYSNSFNYAELYVSNDPACPNFPVSFQANGDNVNSCLWNFGDGSTSTQLYTNHSYSESGSYPVSLKLTNTCGSDTILYYTIHIINDMPIDYASIYVYSEPACPNSLISFYAYGSNIESFLWTFGDGGTSTQQNPNHYYSQVGTYPVTLKMTNYCGNDTLLYYSVHIQSDLPYTDDISLNVYQQYVCPGQSFYFETYTSGNAFLINFGDSTTSTQSYGYHTYTAPGTYTITLTATNECGSDSIITEIVTVDENIPINSAFMYVYEEPACPNTDIFFYASADNIQSFLWDFGDGTTSSQSDLYHSYSQVGSYPVSLKLTNYCGNDTILYHTVHVETGLPYDGSIDIGLYPDYYSGFYYSYDSVIVCPGQPVSYEASFSGTMQIDFGDGQSTSTDNEGIHTYNSPGTYIITLTAINGCGSDSSVTAKVIVEENTQMWDVNINASTTEICPNESVYFEPYYENIYSYDEFDILNMSIKNYLWNFGDGTTSSNYNPLHTFTTVGTYNISLKLTNYCNQDTTVYLTINVSNGLEYSNNINIYLFETDICPGQQFNYYCYGYNSGDDLLIDFGDGTQSTIEDGSHSYSSTGTYTITFTATNSCGNSKSVINQINVIDNLPVYANTIYISEPSACPGNEINFSIGEQFSSYNWNFGDGSTSIAENPSHSYSVLGTYNVSVTITNYCGNSKVLSTSVTIVDNLSVSNLNIYGSSNNVCPGEFVNFSAYPYDSQTLTYSWDFGDGTIKPGQDVQHSFNTAGTYVVTVTATNSCGNQGTGTIQINVISNAYPDPGNYDFGTLNDEFCPGDDVLFYVFPPAASYIWDFGDGTSTTQTVEYLYQNYLLIDVAYHSYTQVGTYSVSLTLTNTCGNSFTESFDIHIGSNIPVDADIDYDSQGYANEPVSFSAYGGSSYLWNFGDGTSLLTTTGNITELEHTYQASGTYNFSVVISNECGNSETLTGTVTILQSNAKEITSFGFNNPVAIGIIDQNNLTVNVSVPYGTNITNLVPSITHTGISISPQSGIATDFTSPKIYTVTAENNTTKSYTVTVTVSPNGASSQKAITAYSFQSFNPPVVATINETAKTITATLPYGTNLSQLVATFTHTGENVIVNGNPQLSGITSNNFNAPVIYTVIAEDASSVNYTILVNTTGIESLQENLFMLVYPNPSEGTFYIKLENINNENILLQIYTLTGQEVYLKKLDNIHDKNEEIKINNLNPGIYFVNIISQEKSIIKKVIITN